MRPSFSTALHFPPCSGPGKRGLIVLWEGLISAGGSWGVLSLISDIWSEGLVELQGKEIELAWPACRELVVLGFCLLEFDMSITVIKAGRPDELTLFGVFYTNLVFCKRQSIWVPRSP